MQDLWSAADLLRSACTLKREVPDAASWSEERFADHPAQLLRFRQLNVLSAAFDIQHGPASVLSGTFIEKRSPAALQQFRQFLLDEARVRHPKEVAEPEGLLAEMVRGQVSVAQLRFFYSGLVHYLGQAYALLDVDRGLLEGFGMLLYGAILREEANEHVRAAIDRIEPIAARILAPDGPLIPAFELMARGWPAGDLRQLEIAALWGIDDC